MVSTDRTFPWIRPQYISPHSYWGLASVLFWDESGDTIVEVLMGDGSAKLTGITGDWGTEDRPGLDPVVLWQSAPAVRQTFPLRFWYMGESINEDWTRFRRLARRLGPRKQPPTIYISGPAVFYTSWAWVIDDVTMNDAVRRADGQMTQLDVDVTLLHYTEMESLVQRSPAKKNRSSKSKGGKGSSTRTGAHGARNREYVVRPGDTLSGIAARTLGSAARWKEIAKLNGIRDPRKIRVHQHLKLP